MKDSPITGSLAVVLEPVAVKPPGPPQTYLGVAEQMQHAVFLLADTAPQCTWALALIAAHGCECALKAYLSRDGKDDHLRAPATRHNLAALWTMARNEGLIVAEAIPAWLRTLSDLHNAPFRLRYSTGVNGVVLPNPQTIKVEFGQLFGVVRAALLADSRV